MLVMFIEQKNTIMESNNYKFKPGCMYNARYTFFSSYNSAGDVTSSTSVNIEISGNSIIKYGLKNSIRYHADRLSIPKGYHCVIEED